MLKAAGALLILLAAAGWSFSICREGKDRILCLKEMKQLYQLLQNEIRYTRLPLPEIFLQLSERLGEPFGEALEKTGRELEEKGGDSLREIWEKNMEKALLSAPLKKEQRRLLLGFPESAGFCESEGQAKALQRFVEELEKWIGRAEEEEKNKNKVIISLGMAGGAFLVLWLL